MRLSPPFSSPFRYVELPEATEMVQHYFGGYRGVLLDAAQRAALEAAWARVVGAGISLTPAQLEELCAEYESVAALCAGLERLAASVSASGARAARAGARAGRRGGEPGTHHTRT